MEFLFEIRRTSSKINSGWERVYTKQKAATKGTDGPMLEYVHIQNLVWNLTMQEPVHYNIFLYILLAACRCMYDYIIFPTPCPTQTFESGWILCIYIYMYDNIISYQWFRYINNINIDNRFSQVIDSTRFHWNTIQQSCSWQDLRSIALFSNLSDCKVWGFSGLQFNHVSLTWDNPLGSMGLHISLHEWKIFMVHVGKYTNSTHLKNII